MECIQLFRRIRINWKFYWCENMGRRHKPHDGNDIITRNEYYKSTYLTCCPRSTNNICGSRTIIGEIM